jgi:hypothetical protein
LFHDLRDGEPKRFPVRCKIGARCGNRCHRSPPANQVLIILHLKSTKITH